MLMDFATQIINITYEHIVILRRMGIPHRVIRKILSYICFPGTLQTLDIQHTCNLIRYAVYTVIVENRKTWGVFDDVVR